MNGNEPSEEPASVQQIEDAAFDLDEAFSDFAGQLAAERAEYLSLLDSHDRLLAELESLKSGGTGSVRADATPPVAAEPLPGGEPGIVQASNGGAPGDTLAASEPTIVVELQPESGHWIKRKLWGRR